MIEDGKTGLLAAPGDAGMAEFTEQVRRLVDDAQLRTAMGKAARAEAERWSWEAATAMLRTQKYAKAIALHDKRLREEGVDTGQVRPRKKPRLLVWLYTLSFIARVRSSSAWHAPRMPANAPSMPARGRRGPRDCQGGAPIPGSCSRARPSAARPLFFLRWAPTCSSRASCCTCLSPWRAPP